MLPAIKNVKFDNIEYMLFDTNDLISRCLCQNGDWDKHILNILKQISEEDYATAEVSLRSLSLAFSDLADELGYDDDTFIQYFSIDEKAMMNDLRIKTTDFASALSNEGEILINGEYIAVSEKLYLRIQELFPGIFR